MRLRCGIEFDIGDPVKKYNIKDLFFFSVYFYNQNTTYAYLLFLKVIVRNTNYEDEVQEIKRHL